MNARIADDFWRGKSLSDLTNDEWERLCDGCGRCCLLKLEDEDTGEIAFTKLACKLLDCSTSQCTDYANRRDTVPDCIQLTQAAVLEYAWLPPSCAYRLRAEGQDLYWWHPLVSGDPQTVIDAGISVAGRCLPEEQAHQDEWEDYLVNWPGKFPKKARTKPPKQQ